MVNLTALKSEFTINPVGLPYLAFTAINDEANANVINNATGLSPRTVNRDRIATSDFLAQTTFAAFDALTASEEAWYRTLTVGESLAVTADTLSTWAAIGGVSIWSTGTKAIMEPRIKALMQFLGSRAQEIRATLGSSFVTPSDVANARVA